MKQFRVLVALCATALIAATSVATAQAATHSTLVATTPSTTTPEVRNGSVEALAQVGDVIVIGGSFTQVADRGQGLSGRSYLAAYDRRTGRLVPEFAPVLDANVWALAPGPVPNSVYVGGGFTKVNGAVIPRVTLLSTLTGKRIQTFRAPGINGTVRTLGQAGNKLFIGGVFTAVGGMEHLGLAALDATTGAADHATTVRFTENHSCGRVSGANCQPVGVIDLAIHPDGTEMTAIGNFRMVDGVVRPQVAVLDIVNGTATPRASWQTSYFTAACYSWAFDYWVRDVDYSPNGDYFVIGSTGGGNADLCDAIGRFESHRTGTNISPTWISSTGGDSVYSLEVTGPVIYAGGHFRWFNNPKAVDRAGAGAQGRPGIAALNPNTGMPLSWNPGRHPRDKGVFEILATESELILGTDTEWFGNKQWYTPRVTQIPLSGGAPIEEFPTRTLPGMLNRLSSDGSSVISSSLTPTSVGSSGSPKPVAGMTNARGAVVLGSCLFVVTSDGVLHRRPYISGTIGNDTSLDPYNDPMWSTVGTGVGGGTETYAGKPTAFHTQMAGLTSLFAVGNRLYYTVGSSTTLRSRVFEPSTGATHPDEQTSVTLPGAVKGAAWADGQLFYVRADSGNLVRQSFDGTTLSGSAAVIGGPTVDSVDYRTSVLFVGAEQSGTLPGEPTITGSTVALASATVTFTPPADTGGQAITGYDVSATGPEGTKSAVLGADATSWTVTGLRDGTAYTVAVAARTSAGIGALATRTVTTLAQQTITLQVSAGTITSGESLTLSGVVTATRAGTPIAGRTVSIIGVSSDSKRTKLTTAVTDAAGAWSATLNPTATLQFQAEVAGDGTYAFGRSRLSSAVVVTPPAAG